MTQVIDFVGGEYRNRTGVHGFAIRCVTTPPTRHPAFRLGAWARGVNRKPFCRRGLSTPLLRVGDCGRYSASAPRGLFRFSGQRARL